MVTEREKIFEAEVKTLKNLPVLFSFLSIGMNSFQKAHDVALGPSPVPGKWKDIF